jgi:hypothetical protein
MESSHTAEFNIPELNSAASVAHVFPGMANHFYFRLEKYATRATYSLSVTPRPQFAIPLNFKF